MTVNRKMPKLLLMMIVLIAAVFPASAFAATGDVNSIEFESAAKVELTVGQSPKQLKVYANVEGSSAKRDVTAAAVFTSFDTDVVKVVNGLVTPVAGGTTNIQAKYNNAIATVEVSVTYPFKELKLEHYTGGNFKLGDSGDKLLVKANATGGSQADAVKDVTADTEWSSSNTNVLSIAAGKISLAGEGSATITAKYKGMTATFKATVQLPYAAIEIRQGSTAVKELETLVGDQPIKVTALTKATAETAEKDVTTEADWSTSNSSVATVEDGEIKILSSGKTVISVSYLGVSNSIDVYARAPYEALLLKPAGDQSLFIGESMKITAEVRNAVDSTLNVSSGAVWSSENQLAATITAEEQTAALAAKAVGSSVIKSEYRGVSKSFKVTVHPTITDLVIDQTEQELYVGDASGLPKVNGTKLDDSKVDMSSEMDWTSSNDKVAVIKDGKIVAETAGTATITGTLKASGDVSGKAAIRGKTVVLKVTVLDKVLILIGPEDGVGLVTGEEQSLPDVQAVMESGEERDVTESIAWTLTGTNAVIKQTADGKVIKGLVKGTASLKGTYANKTITVPVTIEQKVVKIVVESSAYTMNIKGSKSIKVTGYYSNGKTANFSTGMNWESSDPAVATVKGSTVKAVAEGTTTLSGSYQGIAATVKINVVPKLTKLTVSDTRLKLSPGTAQSVSVTALYDTGKTAVVTGMMSWTSSKPSVAKVSANGAITAVGKGTASIKGKLDNKTVTITVTVK